ncbi:MAG: DNA polymerase III subunit gamma/tau [Pelagibacteraceae bacterium]|jgi:DNA polymerase-3 subunit gamma/tau|nr:DNA polymerase III, subunit gamma and tau [Candidatus Pelagibacter sp.]MDP6680859.1 DNA polymerase III subunit gamma/tau [Pelagibacteraceae bacterium]
MKNVNHKILALKYRPLNFDQLIGQDLMAQTITNSIKTNRVANAFLLTGVRGTGKTSTARIISKALTCAGNFTEGVKCKTEEFCHCEEITNCKHLDIIEMDAASKTGVDDVRKEIIESAIYKPTTSRYKIYIIDECHMLSRSSWNALLKTLEEPPDQLKFIFCTTEPKKVPLTIISRCQRYDLHRVTIKVLYEHLKKISKLENGKISDTAISLIAKAATGSVRDALSLLDRALVSQKIVDEEIDETFVRKMLGLATREKILDLLKFILDGDQTKSILCVRQMINEGLDPINFINDLLEIIYFVLQKRNLGNFESDLTISEAELEIIDLISKNVNTSTLILFWQFLLKGLDELSIVANPLLSLEMLVIRLLHLKGMPSYEDLINKNILYQKNEPAIVGEVMEEDLSKEKKDEVTKASKDQIKNTSQTRPELTSLVSNKIEEKSIKSFEELIELSSLKKEIELKYDLEKNVNLIKFSDGKIDIAFNENLSKNFVRNLSEKLLAWTQKRWVITLTKGPGQKTFAEKQFIKKKEILESEKKGEVYKKFKNIFSDGELVEVSKED